MKFQRRSSNQAPLARSILFIGIVLAAASSCSAQNASQSWNGSGYGQQPQSQIRYGCVRSTWFPAYYTYAYGRYYYVPGAYRYVEVPCPQQSQTHSGFARSYRYAQQPGYSQPAAPAYPSSGYSNLSSYADSSGYAQPSYPAQTGPALSSSPSYQYTPATHSTPDPPAAPPAPAKPAAPQKPADDTWQQVLKGVSQTATVVTFMENLDKIIEFLAMVTGL